MRLVTHPHLSSRLTNRAKDDDGSAPVTIAREELCPATASLKLAKQQP